MRQKRQINILTSVIVVAALALGLWTGVAVSAESITHKKIKDDPTFPPDILDPWPQYVTGPFRIVFEPFAIDNAPGLDAPHDLGTGGLHSYVSGHGTEGDVAGDWLMIGGLIGGLHGDSGDSDIGFPPDQRNRYIMIIDPDDQTRYWVPLESSSLHANLIDALSATNAQATQIGSTLWIVGGYGHSSAVNEHVTFGYLIGVDVNPLIEAIKAAGGNAIDLTPFFSWHVVSKTILALQSSSRRQFPEQFPYAPYTCAQFTMTSSRCLMQVTGGGMQRIGDDLYLAFGNRFAGVYTFNPETFRQEYTCRVVRFTPPTPVWGAILQPHLFGQGLNMQVIGSSSNMTACQDGDAPSSDPYHRRDLNVRPAIRLKQPTVKLPTLTQGDSGSNTRLQTETGQANVKAAELAIQPEILFGIPEEYIQVLGGVFQDNDSAFTQPMYITKNGVFTAGGPGQDMSQYEAVSLSLFSASDTSPGIGGTLYTVLLGGISAKECTAKSFLSNYCQTIANAPVSFGPSFIRDGTVIAWERRHLGISDQTYVWRPFGDDIYLGANTHFFPHHDVPRYHNGVIKLDQLPEGNQAAQLVGYMYGGIEVSDFQAFGAGTSFASDRAYRIRIKRH